MSEAVTATDGENGAPAISEELLDSSPAEELSTPDSYDDEADFEIRSAETTRLVPPLFSSRSQIRDELQTETSTAQDRTVDECLPLLTGLGVREKPPPVLNQHDIPQLRRKAHVDFLHDSLGSYPAAFAAMDAARPWLLYWALTGLSLLGEDVTPYGDRCVLLDRCAWKGFFFDLWLSHSTTCSFKMK